MKKVYRCSVVDQPELGEKSIKDDGYSQAAEWYALLLQAEQVGHGGKRWRIRVEAEETHEFQVSIEVTWTARARWVR